MIDPIRGQPFFSKLRALDRICEKVHQKNRKDALKESFGVWSSLSSQKAQAAFAKVLFNARWSDLTSLWRLRVWFLSAKRKARRASGQRTSLGFEKLILAFKKLQESRWSSYLKTMHRFLILVERETHIKRSLLRRDGDGPDLGAHRFGFELLALVMKYRLVSYFSLLKTLPENTSNRIQGFLLRIENLLRRKTALALRELQKHNSNLRKPIDFLNYLAFIVKSRGLELSRKIFDKHRAYLIFKRTSRDTVILANFINLANRRWKNEKKSAFEKWARSIFRDLQQRNEMRIAMTAYADQLFYASERKEIKIQIRVEIEREEREELAIDFALFIKAFFLMKQTQNLKISLVRMGAIVLVQRLHPPQDGLVSYREEQTFSFV